MDESGEVQKCDCQTGRLHIILTFLKVIGKRFNSSGLLEAWTESELFGPNAGFNALAGKHYNRSIRGLKITFEAIFRILWDKIEDRFSQDDCDLSLNEDEPASELSELDRVDSIIREMEKTSNPNAKFWLSYLEMAGILLRFIRAERSGNWKLYLDSFQEMMPWFAAYDRINYLRWGSVYLSNMQRLQITAPEVSVEFEEGNFVVRTKLAHFNGQSVDLSQEHVIKMCKVSGGIIGITRNESALNRWCLTASAMCKMAQKTLFMFDVAIDDGELNDDMKGRKEKDSDTIAVNKLYEQTSTMSLLDNEGANLVNIADGNVASDEITKGLLNARDTGQKSYDEFVSRFSESVESSIQDPITLLKLPTFDSL